MQGTNSSFQHLATTTRFTSKCQPRRMPETTQNLPEASVGACAPVGSEKFDAII